MLARPISFADVQGNQIPHKTSTDCAIERESQPISTGSLQRVRNSSRSRRRGDPRKNSALAFSPSTPTANSIRPPTRSPRRHAGNPTYYPRPMLHSLQRSRSLPNRRAPANPRRRPRSSKLLRRRVQPRSRKLPNSMGGQRPLEFSAPDSSGAFFWNGTGASTPRRENPLWFLPDPHPASSPTSARSAEARLRAGLGWRAVASTDTPRRNSPGLQPAKPRINPGF